MSTVNLKDAEAGLPERGDKAGTGDLITITRHGKPFAALVPLEAAELARKAMAPHTRRSGILPQDLVRVLRWNAIPPRREMWICERVSARYQRRVDAVAGDDRIGRSVCGTAGTYGPRERAVAAGRDAP